MIRGRNALRPDAACHSSDVLTPVERAAERVHRDSKESLQRQMGESDAAFRERVIAQARKRTNPHHDRPLKWRDVPAIRAVLQSLLRANR